MTAADALAQPIAPTVDELSWEQAVDLGAEAWEHGEQAKWDLGDIGVVVSHKWKDDSIKKFANDIGMFDNPKRLYDYVQVASYWNDKAARAEFSKCTWSAFREVARSKMPLAEAAEFMREYGEQPVAAIRRAILGKPSAARERSASFDVGWNAAPAIGDLCPVRFGLEDYRAVEKLITDHPKARIELVVTWTEEATHGD